MHTPGVYVGMWRMKNGTYDDGQFSWMGEWRGLVEVALWDELERAKWVDETLRAAVEYMLFPGGKRLRPLLCLAGVEAVGGEARAGMAAAVAVELFHTYTLIHDDLPAMDDDDERRGRPSCHVQFDEATAILAGDVLQGWSFQVLAGAGRVDVLGELAAVAGPGGVVDGQSMDLQLLENGNIAVLKQMHLLKTARLMEAAVVMGIMCGESSTSQREAGRLFGRHLGLLFQLRDDLLDMETDERSVVVIMGEEEVRAEIEKHAEIATRTLEGLPRPEKLRSLLDYLRKN